VDGTVDPRQQPDLAALARQVEFLERRVSSLEQLVGSAPPERPEETPAAVGQPGPTESWLGNSANVLPLLGKALLGIAGAYLLRALTEFKVFSLDAGVAMGMLYALGWSVLAARTAPEERATAAAYATTSVVILMPLVWEATVRFHAISCWTAASILFLYSAFGLVLSWRKFLSLLATITVTAGVLTSVALLVATDNLAPFTLGLLGTAAAVELAACLRHPLGVRWFAAAAADLAVLLLTYLLSRPGGLPEGYAAVPAGMALAAQMSLLVIYLSSTTVRTLVEGLRVTAFETAQWLIAFLLSLGGALSLAGGKLAAVSAISIFSLACGVACYVVSFAFLSRAGKHDRNFYTYASFGLLLVFAGSRLLVSGLALALVLSILALVCLWTGRESGRMTLKWHGTLYLLAAAVLSGLTAWAAARLLPSGVSWAPLSPAARTAAAAAVLGYALAWRSPRIGSWPWPRRLVVLLLAANCAWTVAGGSLDGLAALCSGPGAPPRAAAFYPTFRTGALTALCLLMAWSGTRWRRFEAVWVAYPLMALIAYKLAAEDLPNGQTLPLFASLFLFGGALILLPRILQTGKTAKGTGGAAG
jgi:hypothetical protein